MAMLEFARKILCASGRLESRLIPCFLAATFVAPASAFAISMDGEGAWRDTVFVERLWRSIKYDEVHFDAHKRLAARTGIGRYLTFYNSRHPIHLLTG